MEKKDNSPKVSVVIPTYKRPQQLPRAVNSVLNQTYDNVEVIVVDDNNPDTEGRKLTEEIMSQYENNDRVIYLKHECNKNGSAARNTGARYSKADYIGFLDDDDEYLPEKISSQVKLLEGLPKDWGFSYSRFYDDINGKRTFSTETRQGYLYLEGLMRTLCFAAGSNLLIRKELFDEVGGFDESFQRTQDLELQAKLLMKSKVAYDPTPGLVVYVHTENRKADIDQLTEFYIQSFQKHIETLSVSDQQLLFKELNKQRFFDHLRSDKSISKCFKMLVRKELTLFDAISAIWRRGFLYLKRKLT